MGISRKEHKAALDSLKERLLEDIHVLRKSYLRHLWDEKWRFESLHGYYISADISKGEYAISLPCGNCGHTKNIIIKRGVKLSDIAPEIICNVCGVLPQKKGQ